MTSDMTDPEMIEAEAEASAEPEDVAPEAAAEESWAEESGAEESGAEDPGAEAQDAEESGSEEAGAEESVGDEAGATDFDNLRLVEALLFASAEPLAPAQLARFLPEEAKLDAILSDLESLYANRGVNLVKRGGRWAFRTAEDLAPRMELENKVVRKLSRVGLETLAVIAYHQPVTRAEIEEIRGVALSKGTLDALLEIGWIRPKGRRKTPGRPVTWGTADSFLDHFGLESLDALPGVEELKAAGLLDARPALTALSDRGLLPGVGEVAPEEVEGDDDDDDDAESDVIEGSERELLEETFGEDLLPQEVDLTAPESAEGAEEPQTEAEEGAAVLAGDAEADAPDAVAEEDEDETGDTPQRSTG
jgi:segregation and condensation protein B